MSNATAWTDEAILAEFAGSPGAGLRGVCVKTGLTLTAVSRALKRLGVVTDRRARSFQPRPTSRSLDTLTEAEWGFVSGVFFAQKRGVYIDGDTVRVVMTISDKERMVALDALLGVGELNTVVSNGGRNVQYVYRMGRRDHVRRFLAEMRARMPRHEWVEAGLACLDAGN